MSQKLKWGIIGAGTIANTFAKGVLESQSGELLAIGSRAQASADEFGDKYNIPRRYASYQALLDDPEVQAVYIATLHPQHAEWAIKAARAKKHILCEKPIGLNHAEAMAIIEAARENDVFLMEAFMYRCHPLIQKLVELVRDKVIGDVRLIRAAFSYSFPSAPDHRARANIHAGGGILDVGCYPISISRLVAGAATGKDFAEPLELKAVGFLGEAGPMKWPLPL